jgi:outer membrane receptor protein involved in Fe transport
VSRDILDVTSRSNPIAERRTLRIVGGFQGEIPNTGFDYELSFNYGRTDADVTARSRIEDRFFAAVDAVVDPGTGQIVCRSDIDSSATVPPSSPFPVVNDTFGITTFQPGDGQCVPLNIFGVNSITQEAADFVFIPTTGQSEIEQRNFLATVSGDSSRFFELPAGPIGFALGYEYRDERSQFDPDSFDRAGLTFGTLDSRGGPTNPSAGGYEVNEFFFEGNVPLLADLPFVRRLEVNGAVRFSDYDVFDNTTTWTAGARYAPVDSLAFRATYSRAVRVPNIGEAFSPQFTVTLGASQDPCNPQFINGGSEFRLQNCIALVGPSAGAAVNPYNSTNFLSAFVPGVSGGNPDLNPEAADTLTIGAVYRPDGDFDGALDGLVVTVDYYDIEIDGLIDSLGAFDIAQNCVDAPSLDNQFCDAIDRDPTFGFITGFRSGLINLDSVEVKGIDWRIDYRFETPAALGGVGSWRLSSLGTRFLQNDEVRDPSNPDDVTGVLGTLSRPNWIINFNADWLVGDWTLGWRGRYESSQLTPGLEPADLVSNPDFVNIARTGGAFVNDFSASYAVTEKIEFYGGVNNVTDRDPFIGQLSRPAGPRGRFFFLGANIKL